jgi:uncharacterized protein (DUF488 family)
MPAKLLTIGHSNHSFAHICKLLKKNGVGCIVDVRSQPYSRHNPQFNREAFSTELQRQSIAYEFMGHTLGARSTDPSCIEAGRVSYRRLAATVGFQEGLGALLRIATEQTVALMCAEKDPLTCHRTILVCRNLRRPGIEIQHILYDGSLESNAITELRLFRMFNSQPNLFMDMVEKIEEAYDRQAEEIAWRVDPSELDRQALG